MTKEIKKLKKQYFFLTSAVVVVTVLITIGLFVLNNVREDRAEFMSALDRNAAVIADQLANNEVPSVSSENGMTVFIIHQKDGSPIVQRRAPDDDLWLSYQSKLMYQMQKQQRGWIYYPQKKPWEVWKAQRVIRYVPVNAFDWILAVEAAMVSPIESVLKHFDSFFALVIGLWVLAAVALIWVIIKHSAHAFRKAISETLENNFLSMVGDSTMVSKFSGSLVDSASVHNKAENKDNSKPIDLFESASSKQETKNELTPEYGEETKDQAESLKSKYLTDQKSFISMAHSKKRKADSLQKEGPQNVGAPDPVKEQEPTAEKPKEDESLYDGMTINDKQVKSDVLKKMLKDLRGK